jgi:hypothetical protein
LQPRPIFPKDIRARLMKITNSDWAEFLKVREYIRPLFPKGSDRVLLVPDKDVPRHIADYEFHDLTMMNIIRTVTTMVFRGYADNDGKSLGWDSGITDEELNRFFYDFREAGIDLAIVDERNEDTGKRAFIEGNLFNYSSDGLNPDAPGVASKLNFRESMEMFSFLWSGGQMANDLYERLHKNLDARSETCAKGPKDAYGRDKLSRACVLEELPAVLDELLVNMPGLRQFLRLLPPDMKTDYMRGVLETAFNPRWSLRDWVEMSELSTLAVILHYSEAVMTNYDKNGDGILDNGEIEAAVKVFKGYIKKFQKDTKCQTLPDVYARGAFLYILKYRELPVTFWDFSLNWVTWVSAGDLSLNRADLSGVFRVIIAKLFEPKKKKESCEKGDPPPPPTESQLKAANAACHDFMIWQWTTGTPLQPGQQMIDKLPAACRSLLPAR